MPNQSSTGIISSEVSMLKEMGKFNFINKYARYNNILERRETWEECVDRVHQMHYDKFKKILTPEDLKEIEWAFDMVKQQYVVPSMRSMQFAGKAINIKNLRMYNCTGRHVDSIRAFAEIMYLLLLGCGVGIGVSKKFINKIPSLVDKNDKTGTVITYVVEDSVEGWSDSVEALLMCYCKNTPYTGRKIIFDYSKIRPEGSPLKVSGGKAPGYKGLKKCHKLIKQMLDYIIEELNQKKLKPINAYDIIMHCADAVISGGVRRSATICLFDHNDEEMLNAKTYFPVTKFTKFGYDEDTKMYYGKVTVSSRKHEVQINEYDHNELVKNNRIYWKYIEPQRARSNNSVALNRETCTQEQFEKIIQMTKQFGEPGFVFLTVDNQLVNPCSEISWIPINNDGDCVVVVCNLTSINGAKCDTYQKFKDCIKAATIIGTLQASYTNTKYINELSKEEIENESLLGVSIAGMMDNPEILLNPLYQKNGALYACEVNEIWAKKLGIKPAARVTCIKPDGNTSVTLGCAPGIHPHHSQKYLRRIQCNKNDTVYKLFKETNPHMCEHSVWSANKSDDVITFPIEIHKDAMFKKDLTALQHLEIIKNTQINWVNNGTSKYNTKPITHNVSCTVLVKEDEWKDVIKYVFDNREYFAAVSFLPNVEGLYEQSPYEAVTTPEQEQKWDELLKKYKPVNYKKLHEDSDNTKLNSEVACGGGACEIL